MVNSADPDQLASSEANWSGSTMFAKQDISGFSRTMVNWLAHCRLNRLSHTIYWKSPILILGVSSYEIYIFLEKNG